MPASLRRYAVCYCQLHDEEAMLTVTASFMKKNIELGSSVFPSGLCPELLYWMIPVSANESFSKCSYCIHHILLYASSTGVPFKT